MSKRIDKDRQYMLEPKRLEYAKKKIEELGYNVLKCSETELRFDFNNHHVYFFPYSGWHSGSEIKDGRGLQKLLRQIK